MIKIKSILLYLINIYKNNISKHKPYMTCKFVPCCSDYCFECIQKHNLLKGTLYCILRILRCNPFNKRSNYDPVP